MKLKTWNWELVRFRSLTFEYGFDQVGCQGWGGVQAGSEKVNLLRLEYEAMIGCRE